jgi:hypothetical protein
MSRLFTPLLVVVCLLSHVQTLRAQPVTAGIKAGLTAARLPGVNDVIPVPVDEESRWGGTVGVFVTVPLNELIAFEPEALYVMKGATFFNHVGTGSSLSFDANYLDMPLHFKFGRSGRPYFLAGPSVGFRLAAEARETVSGATETRDFSDQIKSVDVGVSFGAGASFGRFLIEGRWTEGLRDVDSQGQFESAVRHRVIGVLAGFRF